MLGFSRRVGGVALGCSPTHFLLGEKLPTFDADLMTGWKISPDVGNVRNNRPELIDEVKEDHQKLL
jgi:hypothetical protein